MRHWQLAVQVLAIAVGVSSSLPAFSEPDAGEAWDRRVAATEEAAVLWSSLVHVIRTVQPADGAPAITPADRDGALAEMEGLRSSLGANLAMACSAGGSCATADVIQAVAIAVDDYLVKREPDGFALAGEAEVPRGARLKAFGRKVSAYALYTGTVFALGYGMDLIPAGAGPTKTMVAILAGTIIADSGAFWRDNLGAKLRTFFFKLANGAKTEARKLPMYTRFQSIWQNGKDLASDTVRDGAGKENSALVVELTIIREAINDNVSRQTAIEMLAFAMERYRATFFDVPTGATGTLTQENAAAIERMFGLALKGKFGNAESYFDVLTALKIQDLEYAKANAERQAEIMKSYKELGVLWFQPERWTAPMAGAALLAEYEKRAPNLDKAAGEAEAQRKALVEESLRAAAGPCGKTAAGVAAGG